MHPLPFIRRLHSIMVALVVMAVAIVPIGAPADTAHADPIPMTISADIVVNGDDPMEDPSHEGQGNTAHHCATCHVHMITGAGAHPATTSTLQKEQYLINDAAPYRVASEGPYRPPRV